MAYSTPASLITGIIAGDIGAFAAERIMQDMNLSDGVRRMIRLLVRCVSHQAAGCLTNLIVADVLGMGVTTAAAPTHALLMELMPDAESENDQNVLQDLMAMFNQQPENYGQPTLQYEGSPTEIGELDANHRETRFGWLYGCSVCNNCPGWVGMSDACGNCGHGYDYH